jgi:THO complex subunit 4
LDIQYLSIILTALDDIIKANPRKRGGGARGRGSTRRISGGGGARAAALGKGAANAAQNAAAIAAANRAKAPLVIPGRVPGGKDFGSKVIVSNLPFDVTEAQVKVRYMITHFALKSAER